MLPSHCENMLAYAAAVERRAMLVDPRRYRPNAEVAPNCPRCDSPNTKFCYYNNYSLSQPRYFCKGCRRYWTKGGSLRNVPVGGGCRKNRRGKPARSMVDAAASANQGAAAVFSHRFDGPVRPDLLLEGMVGHTAELGQSHTASPDKPAGAADGPTIDLALLYSKFLSHQPLAEQCAVVPESADTLSGSSAEMSPTTLSGCGPSQHGFGEISGPASSTEPSHTATTTMLHARAPLSEFNINFSVDQSCYDSLGLPTDGGDLMLPSPWDKEAKYEPFNPLPEEDAMSLHAGGDDDWSKVLGCQGLEAALSAGLDRC